MISWPQRRRGKGERGEEVRGGERRRREQRGERGEEGRGNVKRRYKVLMCNFSCLQITRALLFLGDCVNGLIVFRCVYMCI